MFSYLFVCLSPLWQPCDKPGPQWDRLRHIWDMCGQISSNIGLNPNLIECLSESYYYSVTPRGPPSFVTKFAHIFNGRSSSSSSRRTGRAGDQTFMDHWYVHHWHVCHWYVHHWYTYIHHGYMYHGYMHHGYMHHGHICVGHTAWAPEGREGRSQGGPKGRRLEVGARRAP